MQYCDVFVMFLFAAKRISVGHNKIVLYYIVLYCNVLYCIVLYCIVLYYKQLTLRTVRLVSPE